MIMIMIMKKMMVVEKIIHANWDSAKFHGAADASALPSHLQSENFPLLYRVFFFHCVSSSPQLILRQISENRDTTDFDGCGGGATTHHHHHYR